MRKIVFLTFLLTAAGISQAVAQGIQPNCEAPIAPVAPNGRTASQQQMTAANADARNFISQSDVYQQCLLDWLKAQKDQAAQALQDKSNKDARPFDPYVETIIQKKIDDNQKTKVQVGAEYSTALADYKITHRQ